MLQGREREINCEKSVYQDDSYFDLVQLSSFIYQIRSVRDFSPQSLIEIGVGSGFTSGYLRSAGYDVTTVDINQNLNPDICSDLANLPNINLNKVFDLVVCCQVLEHIPLNELESNLEILSKLGRNLYLTLPSYYSYFGIGGILRLPHIRKDFGLYLKSPFKTKNLNDGIHLWEVDSEKNSSRKVIEEILRKFYSKVSISKIPLNPYHIQFKCFK